MYRKVAASRREEEGKERAKERSVLIIEVKDSNEKRDQTKGRPGYRLGSISTWSHVVAREEHHQSKLKREGVEKRP